MVKYTFERDAYAKIVLHAAKYTTEPVTGVVLCRAANAVTDSSDEQKHDDAAASDTLVIVDTIPLFHHHALAPVMQMAMTQVDLHCAKHRLRIAGVYHAGERLSNTTAPAPCALQLVNRIKAHNTSSSGSGKNSGKSRTPPTVMFMVDNKAVAHDDVTRACLSVLTQNASTQLWNPASRAASSSSSSSSSSTTTTASSASSSSADAEADDTDTAAAIDTAAVTASSCGSELHVGVTDADTYARVRDMVLDDKRELCVLLTDFEDHLEDMHRSWLNRELFK